jgi:hypothetical protein
LILLSFFHTPPMYFLYAVLLAFLGFLSSSIHDIGTS